nr:UvrD-helicase domain-containing protein [Adlercreutzia mucosicola]
MRKEAVVNLERCTTGQRQVVTTLDEPLMVSAGAGSGKTFTLTQRVAYALAPGEGEAPYLASVGELLAITFTTKAAAELKGRIKGLLIEEGLEEEALSVDDAWVSTIHGMAARILREHALEVGLDPAFEVIGEVEADELLAEAIEEVVARAEEAPSGLVRDLLAREKLRGSSFNDKGAVEYAAAVRERVSAMPAGFAGLDTAGAAVSPSALMRGAVEAAGEMRAVADTWMKPSARKAAFRDRLHEAARAAEAWLAESTGGAFADEDFDAEGFCAAFYGLPLSTGARIAKEDVGAFEAWQTAMIALEREVRAALAQRWQAAVVALAREIDDQFAALKGPSRLDNNDLLTTCARALAEHPSIADALRRRFKIIMVDEFQDTDRLQVDIIGRIARPGFANVCTVGDAQQSIYRFRGADVNVFTEYQADLCGRAGGGALVELDWNFRSHGDVLAFVESVFSQSEVFGDDFLRLAAKGPVNGKPDALFDGTGRPRVSAAVTHYPFRGLPSAEARGAAARAVAEHFADLAAAGARPGDMVILLGKMSHAHRYAEALREVGLASMIAGGSVFASMAEPQLVAALLRWATNVADDEALYAVIASPLFAVSDDALLALASARAEDGSMRSCRLSAGLLGPHLGEWAVELGLSENDREALGSVRTLLAAFARMAREGQPVRALRQLLVASGLLDRLQAAGVDGLAQAANFAKALRIVGDLAEDATGVASLAQAFDAHLACAKEAPGALATAEGDFVRIMTVHASKGLEFPHVAVADLKDGIEGAGRLVVENVGPASFAAASFMPLAPWQDAARKFDDLARKLGVDADEEPEALLAEADDPVEALGCLTLGGRYRVLGAYARAQALAEARRLLYVALTRASKSLFLSLVFRRDPAKGYEGTGIFEDLYRALEWSCEGERSVTEAAYGGSAPARIVFQMLRPAADEAEGDEAPAGESAPGEPSAPDADGASSPAVKRAEDEGGATEALRPFVVPERAVPPLPPAVPFNFARAGLYSYTSLSGARADSDELVAADGPIAPLLSDVMGGEEDAGAASLLGTVAESGSEEAGAPRAASGPSGANPAESATALGTAFHRLAQQAIERSERGALFCPDEAAITAQIQKEALSASQQQRLRTALARWLASDEAARFSDFAHRGAEVPFIVAVPAPSAAAADPAAAAVEAGAASAADTAAAPEGFFLEGEIDGLADNGDGAVLLIDYKTGGTPDETPEALDGKHRLQASCYAYALMRAGYTSVDAHFLRIEHQSADNPRDPQIVPYHFEASDLPQLEALIQAKQKEAVS